MAAGTTSHRMLRSMREKLIEEVQSYPMLYDTNHESHRDNDTRDRAWLQISAKLGVNSETLKREWKILRDSLRQAIRKHKQTVKHKGRRAVAKSWYFESKMAFLLPFMTQRPVYQTSDGSAEALARLDAAETAELDEGGAGGDALDPGSAALWTNEDERLPRETSPETGAGARADDLELFFASVCQSCRRLPRALQAAVKRQVLDALLRAEDQLNSSSADHKLPHF